MKTVDQIVRAMTLDEKIALIAGKNFWQMEGVPSAGLEQIMQKKKLLLQAGILKLCLSLTNIKNSL